MRDASPLLRSIATAALVLLALTIGTGLLLSLYYEPATSISTSRASTVGIATAGASRAWSSVEITIGRDVAHGAAIRSIHATASSMLIAMIGLGLVVVATSRRWRTGGACRWYRRIALFLLLCLAGYTGSILPWNRLSFSASSIGAGLANEGIPLLGPLVAELLRGGDATGQATLTRAFALHTIWLPGVIVALAVGMLWRDRGSKQWRDDELAIISGRTSIVIIGACITIISLAMIIGERVDSAHPLVLIPLAILPIFAAHSIGALVRSEVMSPSDTHTDSPHISATGRLALDALVAVILLGVIVTIAVVAPLPRGGAGRLPYDPMHPFTVTGEQHPEWYLMPLFGLLQGLKATTVVAIAMGTLLLAALLPTIDRRGTRWGYLLVIACVAVGVVWIVATVIGYVAF